MKDLGWSLQAKLKHFQSLERKITKLGKIIGSNKTTESEWQKLGNQCNTLNDIKDDLEDNLWKLKSQIDDEFFKQNGWVAI